MSNKKTALYRYLKSEGLWDDWDTKADIFQKRNKNVFEIGDYQFHERKFPQRRAYLVLTDREADKRAKEEIEHSLWAFKASFLANHLPIPEESIASMQNSMYEEASSVFRNLLTKKKFNKLVDDAIYSYGREHFLNTYDGNENSETVGKTTYYIYRTN